MSWDLRGYIVVLCSTSNNYVVQVEVSNGRVWFSGMDQYV